MAPSYTPLKFIDQYFKDGTILFTDICDRFVPTVKEMTEEEFVNFCLSADFLDPEYNGKWKALNTFMFQHTPDIAMIYNFTPEDISSGKLSLAAEWRDVLLMPTLLHVWETNKQVYKLDADFAKALMHSEKLILTKDMMEHLPCNAFYLDLSDQNAFDSVQGIFTTVFPTDTRLNITTALLTKPKDIDNNVIFSYYFGADYDKNGEIPFRTADAGDKTINRPFLISNNVYELEETETITVDSEVSRFALSILPIQLCAYLSVKEPDIKESAITKSTYRKPAAGSIPKNKFSELQIWEAGYRYGSVFRKKREEYKEQLASEFYEKEGSAIKRKPPIPHYRSAHWQNFWYGPRNSEDRHTELRWIEPVFVGGKEASIATIHKVKGTPSKEIPPNDDTLEIN